jgi:hypothetical protein
MAAIRGRIARATFGAAFVASMRLTTAGETSGGETSTTTELPASGELSCERSALGTCRFKDPQTGLSFEWPNDWPVRRLKLLTESGPPAHARQSGAMRWISVEYLPDDPAQPEASMFRLAVLRRGDWIAQSNRSRSVADVEVATGRDEVVVAAVQESNPYPPESRDADIFDALRPSVEDISRIVWLDEPVRPRRLQPDHAATYAHAQ